MSFLPGKLASSEHGGVKKASLSCLPLTTGHLFELPNDALKSVHRLFNRKYLSVGSFAGFYGMVPLEFHGFFV